MRRLGTGAAVGLAGTLVAVLSLSLGIAPVATGAESGPPGPEPPGGEGYSPTTIAAWEMNEPLGASLMVDSGPGGKHVAFDPTGVTSGFSADGATGYSWARRPPNAYPPSPERIIQVPDAADVDPGSGTFTISLRYRTKENFGNITQKGQARSRGGQWKIQNPQGIPSCLFSGSLGRAATRAKTPLNDNQWHVLTCVRTASAVTMYVDGEFRNRKVGPTGVIDNTIPMTIGGKINCDQIDTTCDYFSGQIDWIRIERE